MFAQTSALSSSLLVCQQRTALRSRQAQQVHAIHCGTSQSNTVIQTQETTCKQEAKCTCGKTRKPPNCDGSHAKKSRAAQIRAGKEVLVQLSGQTTVAQAHMLE
ncbi:hypothetical protein COCSUDRAFT_52474 [Coccomyxa subellipsoidea C-169]|uniref:Iron-binding zinc finger CDGSH type domain-containing protein n=1 Tax=Coccomyxa subellipsoidea (strain C-169) TaxID=574566 RepID=I0Z874_COCSC|nr:hypothetical protein COCSUDRAFT_52474 [Coccomyxa subellipsoidea C-169]EIE26843.1 hypothetical protein COCSUDRAFT_52474 [Coccomyxa subellipsoidea C-169]|eukprot:XP_005651387.1 hypothetical protein COCSUDRAFT_52474 [Coccomyxa subellipsoidea C-169]